MKRKFKLSRASLPQVAA